MDLFYTPQYAKTGDVIPYYDEETKRFENFYLKNWNPDAPKEQVVYGWHRITTTDNRHYEEIPTGIHGGTGSIVKVDGLYHMFYCTFQDHPQLQWARHATSRDLTHWEDIPEDKFGADGVIYKLLARSLCILERGRKKVVDASCRKRKRKDREERLRCPVCLR